MKASENQATLVRPFQRLKPPPKPIKELKTSRKNFAKIRRKRDYITVDEVNQVKNQKNLLLLQKEKIQSQIARLEMLPYHESNPKRNRFIAQSVSKQIEGYEMLIKEKKDEINQVRISDIASSITEFQEESKIMHLENVRLQILKKEVEKELENSRNRLNTMIDLYSPEQIQAIQNEISELKKKIAKKEKSIDLLEYPEHTFEQYRIAKEKKELEKEERKKKIKQIKQLKREIRKEKRNIEIIRKQIDE